MNDWQIDLMIAREAEAAWSRLNAPDPESDRMKKASVEMKSADEFLGIVTDRLAEAMAVLDGTPMADKVASFLNQIEDIHCDLFTLTEKYGRGERE